MPHHTTQIAARIIQKPSMLGVNKNWLTKKSIGFEVSLFSICPRGRDGGLCWCRCSDRDGYSSHLRSSPQAGPIPFREPMQPCGHLPPSLEEPWNFLVNICRQNITRSPQMVNLNLIFDFPVNFYREIFTRNPSVPIPTCPSQPSNPNVTP